MNYYLLTLQYAGTCYAGFQWQNGPNTVQSELNLALEKILYCKLSTNAASRTDAGVHAIEQLVKLTCEKEIKINHFLDSLNTHLPKDIRCLNIISCPGELQITTLASSKEYRYFFTNQILSSSDHCPYVANIARALDIEKMNKCAQSLVGKHDFCNFYSTGSNVSETVREIFSCEISLINPQDIFTSHSLFQISDNLKSCYQLQIKGPGFLKQMIRHIVSGLWMVGTGKMKEEDFIKLIDSYKREEQLWKVAPAKGLFLYKINY